MGKFDRLMQDHQREWRKKGVKTSGWGKQNGRRYEWILPPHEWEQGLWPEIRSTGAYPLPAYLAGDNPSGERIQRHQGSHNLKSSWVLCANLYFPFGVTEGGRALLAGFLREHVDPEITCVDRVELEYAATGTLSPSQLLGEQGGTRGAGQTSPDVAFLVNGGKGIVLTENKFVEHSFYRCSARKRKGSTERPANPHPERCLDLSTVLEDHESQCHQQAWGRKYWDLLAPSVVPEKAAALKCCPAALAGYQLFRQQALAEGMATSGAYDLVVSCVAVDERNDTLQHCLKSTGLKDLGDWGDLLDGKARWSVFTHQDWVGWVRDHGDRQWLGWLAYVRARYGLGA